MQLNLVASLSEGSLVATSCSSQGNSTRVLLLPPLHFMCVSPSSQRGVIHPLPPESLGLNQSSVMSSSYSHLPVIKSHAHLMVIKSHAHLMVIRSHAHLPVNSSHVHLSMNTHMSK